MKQNVALIFAAAIIAAAVFAIFVVAFLNSITVDITCVHGQAARPLIFMSVTYKLVFVDSLESGILCRSLRISWC